MRIPGSSTASLKAIQQPNEMNSAGVEKLKQDEREELFQNKKDSVDLRSINDFNADNELNTRFVRRSSDVGEIVSLRNDKPQLSKEQLPLSTRRALQAFTDNIPSPDQKLGIELVGIDIIV